MAEKKKIPSRVKKKIQLGIVWTSNWKQLESLQEYNYAVFLTEALKFAQAILKENISW